ncbi:hypothetical protein R3P38DRAFT_3493949 [Favolaschia claudopus]|uniref:Uncharacterized protein n=1 Tax=Favolaschia claudopus TaxID=2862362 RepID=A0AAW0C972_9AGAR
MSYAEYSTLHHQTRFSAEFFNTITLADVEGLFQNDVLPHVLPRDSVTKWNLDRTVPSAIAEIVVAAGEEIPCYHDLFSFRGGLYRGKIKREIWSRFRKKMGLDASESVVSGVWHYKKVQKNFLKLTFGAKCGLFVLEEKVIDIHSHRVEPGPGSKARNLFQTFGPFQENPRKTGALVAISKSGKKFVTNCWPQPY